MTEADRTTVSVAVLSYHARLTAFRANKLNRRLKKEEVYNEGKGGNTSPSSGFLHAEFSRRSHLEQIGTHLTIAAEPVEAMAVVTRWR